MPQSAKFIMGLVIKRASLERDYKSQPLADCGINFHTTYEYSGIHLRTSHTLQQYTVRLTSSSPSSQPPDECSPAALHSECGVVSLWCMFMLCARFMTSRVNVNNAICRRSVHEISFKRSAFDFMHSNRLCRWRYLLSLGEESMRACNINIHPSDSLTVLIKAPSTRNPSIAHS